ncbi:MAG: D-alanyl-D-alanine carboxypeptidase/D-alanyl-D-alanine-endopeptidase [Paracoccaceae bacterium]
MIGRRAALVAAAAALILAGGASAPVRAPLPLARATAADAPQSGEVRAKFGLAGRSGWVLIDLGSGEVLDAEAAEVNFAPASVAKLPTALYALDRLGPDHRFETRLMATGPVTGGHLAGDLVLVGGGDPELDSDALADIVAEARAAGLRTVAGRFAVDAGLAPTLPVIATDQPPEAPYNPAVSALNLNFNRVRLRWGQGTDKTPTLSAKSTRADPRTDYVRAELEATSLIPFAHSVTRDGETWRLDGRLFRGKGARWLPVRRPELYAGDVFRTLAAAAGLPLEAPEARAVPPAAEPLVRRASRPLAEILRDMLDFSTNVTAEVVGRAAGGQPAPTTLAGSAARMNAWMAARLDTRPGDPRIAFDNHSGLSVTSRAAPARIAALLADAARAPMAGLAPHPRLPGPAAALLPSVNVAAASEPLDYDRLEIVAKTGTMDYIRGLAGYVATPGGRQWAFAIFSNHLAGRTGGTRQIDRGWMAKARGFERALIRSWVRRFDGETRASR